MEPGQREHQGYVTTESRLRWWGLQKDWRGVLSMRLSEKMYICGVSSTHNCDIFSQGFDKSGQGSKKLSCQTELRLVFCRLDVTEV